MMKFLKYVFVLLFLLCIAVCGAGFYFYKTFNPNDYKGKIETVASEALNRSFKINGDIEIALSLIPTITINDIEISNPEWAVSPYFLKIKEADVTFKIKPLFDKKIEIDSINVNGSDINLEVAKNGEQNWIFAQEAAKNEQNNNETKSSSETAITNNAAALSLGGLMLNKAKIKNGKITYFDAKTKQKETLVINHIVSGYIDENSPLSLDADVQYDAYRIDGKIETGSLNQFMNNSVNLPIKTDIAVNNASLVFDGTISELSEKAVITGKINAYNPAGSFIAP